ncbi:uncharacterized protein MONBRDRAFT_37007 [Monosiga brevicollis MX1]|uniref:Uncharacterized protein n=1 Tax=Monosiga brevicollis TaxID=81824 RepID=A9UYZ9_MONBE|nr:uncharacterized protein MONBRDRAFT_37007 [Monosiga brevicollis MX1]EDQ89546.1 predicted protein [Monosiga brevicollis MX1]|eukprot:XP_001745575.1 hypothetical protein [Monosiga brevicollis MX1]
MELNKVLEYGVLVSFGGLVGIAVAMAVEQYFLHPVAQPPRRRAANRPHAEPNAARDAPPIMHVRILEDEADRDDLTLDEVAFASAAVDAATADELFLADHSGFAADDDADTLEWEMRESLLLGASDFGELDQLPEEELRELADDQDLPAWMRMAIQSHLAYEAGDEQTGHMLHETAKLLLVRHERSAESAFPTPPPSRRFAQAPRSNSPGLPLG